jgi:hypothetical protein
MRSLRTLVPALSTFAAAGAAVAFVVGPPSATEAPGAVHAAADAAAAQGQLADPSPTFDPANFSGPEANPYFPLQPGTVTRYRGSEDGVHFRERVEVLHRTRLVDGVRARVVRDVLRRADGSVAERTHDWYAADDDGNVWYLGEKTATYNRHGHLQSREGSWEAGVHGATPGLIMPADPHATDAYRQEFWRGHAEDQAWIVGKKATVRVPLGVFHGVVRSFEWTRLEPHVVSVKLYARGVGIAAEYDVAGGTERFELVSVSR